MNHIVPNAHLYCDKFLVRNLLRDTFKEDFCVPILADYNHPDEIDYVKLPNSFVLKCNHGSSMNIIVKNKSSIDKNVVFQKLNSWLNTDYAKLGREYQYKNIRRKIIAENLIQPLDKDNIIEYYFFMFNGVFKLLQLKTKDEGGFKNNFYDVNWNLLNLKSTNVSNFKVLNISPKFEKMKLIAESMAKDFYFVRIDFLTVKDDFYFSEITFHDSGGLTGFNSMEWDFEIGSWLTLPKV
jgi:hypothetical protein